MYFFLWKCFRLPVCDPQSCAKDAHRVSLLHDLTRQLPNCPSQSKSAIFKHQIPIIDTCQRAKSSPGLTSEAGPDTGLDKSGQKCEPRTNFNGTPEPRAKGLNEGSHARLVRAFETDSIYTEN